MGITDWEQLKRKMEMDAAEEELEIAMEEFREEQEKIILIYIKRFNMN